MKVRSRYLLLLVAVVGFLGAMAVGYRSYDEWRKKREEEVGNNLVIDVIDWKDATVVDVARQIQEKVHAMEHPELRLRIYSDLRQVPHFHAMRIDRNSPDPDAPVTAHLTFAPVTVLIRYASGLTNRIELTGNDLIVLPVPGTTRPFRHVVYRLYPGFFENRQDETIRGFFPIWYEGMSLEFRRKQLEVEFIAPEDDVELLDRMLSVTQLRRPTWMEQAKSVLRYGRTISRSYR